MVSIKREFEDKDTSSETQEFIFKTLPDHDRFGTTIMPIRIYSSMQDPDTKLYPQLFPDNIILFLYYLGESKPKNLYEDNIPGARSVPVKLYTFI